MRILVMASMFASVVATGVRAEDTADLVLVNGRVYTLDESQAWAEALAIKGEWILAVGSNDLTQYMLAVDRNNPRVASLYQETHPAVLNALREVARDEPLRNQPHSQVQIE